MFFSETDLSDFIEENDVKFIRMTFCDTFGNMKNIVEQHFPILNKVNPAALISDAFYSVSVYENMERYRMNLMILGAITVLCTVFCVIKLRRERYDSL